MKYKRIKWSWFHWIYELLEDDTFTSKLQVPGTGDYDIGLLQILRTPDGSRITNRKSFRWNGATCAPDFKRVIRGTCYHDNLYDNLSALAEYLHCPISEVRRWADKVFNEVNKEEGFWRALKRVYFRAVRRFGWISR